MPFTTKDLRAYRRDEQFGHKLLTPEERIKLLKVRISGDLSMGRRY